MNKFSTKKLLLCVIITIFTTCFLTTTLLIKDCFKINADYITTKNNFNYSIKNNVKVESIYDTLKSMKDSLDNNSELLKYNDKLKTIYGEEYPTELYLISKAHAESYSDLSNYIIKIYSNSILLGLTFGLIIYIIFIQKAKGKTLLLESIFSIGSIVLFIIISNMGYYLITSILIKNNSTTLLSTFSNSSSILYQVLLFFIIILVISFIINYIYQKYITHKLNSNLK